jgi:hyperosmotically inducible periplasmic protein
MKNFIVGLFLGIVLLIAVIWFYGDKNSHAEKAKDEIKNAAVNTKDFVKDKLDDSNLSADDIKDELARTGKVVRQKAHEAKEAVADATADARITAAIKTKLLRDPDLSAISISVTTTDGRVELSGTASSPENIRKAMQLALETDGVHEVVSTLQVKN